MQKKHLLTISWSVHSYKKKVYTIQIGLKKKLGEYMYFLKNNHIKCDISFFSIKQKSVKICNRS